jgi:hypothetical protein
MRIKKTAHDDEDDGDVYNTKHKTQHNTQKRNEGRSTQLDSTHSHREESFLSVSNIYY